MKKEIIHNRCGETVEKCKCKNKRVSMVNEYKKCEYCNGRGKVRIRIKYHYISDAIKRKCIKLRKEGYSFRQIAKKLKFRNHQSVASAIKTYVK